MTTSESLENLINISSTEKERGKALKFLGTKIQVFVYGIKYS